MCIWPRGQIISTFASAAVNYRVALSLGSPAGLAIGAGASLILGRLMVSLLYGVQPADPLTLSAVCVILLAASVFASFIPARAASNLEPLIALRRD